MPSDITKNLPFNENKVMHEVNAQGLMEKRNVVTAYVGTKKVNGQDTGEPCVVICVHDKMSESILSKKDIIPKKLRSGVKTDIIVRAKIVAHSYTPGTIDDLSTYLENGDPNCAGERVNLSSGWGSGCHKSAWKHRPLVGGISISTVKDPYGTPDLGSRATLGAIVKDSTTNRLVMLSNNHVLCNDTAVYDTNYKVPDGGVQALDGEYIMQPAKSDYQVWYDIETFDNTHPDWNGLIVGRSLRVHPIQFGTDSDQDNQVDGGIGDIDIGSPSSAIFLLHAGPFPFADLSEYTSGDPVYISSRTTGYKPPPTAYIVSTNSTSNVLYGSGDNSTAKFTNQILIDCEDDDDSIVKSGDSGSVVVAYINNMYKIIGLLFAGTTDHKTIFANRIEDVASTLNIEAWDGKITLPINSYGASFDDVCYHKIKTVKRHLTHVPDYIYGDCEECQNPVVISFTDETGNNVINDIWEIPIVGGATLRKHFIFGLIKETLKTECLKMIVLMVSIKSQMLDYQ
jgi:hypothetical protein